MLSKAALPVLHCIKLLAVSSATFQSGCNNTEHKFGYVPLGLIFVKYYTAAYFPWSRNLPIKQVNLIRLDITNSQMMLVQLWQSLRLYNRLFSTSLQCVTCVLFILSDCTDTGWRMVPWWGAICRYPIAGRHAVTWSLASLYLRHVPPVLFWLPCTVQAAVQCAS